MKEPDCEIEYLDEDADIVEQLFQHQSAVSTTAPIEENKSKSLLLERLPKRKRNLRSESDDDYDPEEDITELAHSPPPSPKSKKKKTAVLKKENTQVQIQKPLNKKLNIKKVMSDSKVLSANQQYSILKKLNIRIPDFDDPLCLPVKAVNTDISDCKRLDTWNKVCLEHFKHCDTLLKPEKGETKSSSRTVVLRNVFNKKTGRKETTVWSKTCVMNEDSDKKSEIFQCILPNYQEKKTLNIASFGQKKSRSTKPVVDEIVLLKEDHKERETLVVYKPLSGISTVFNLVDKRKQDDENNDTLKDEKSNEVDEEVKMYLKEVTCCRMCVHCFQESWRGLKKIKGPIVCPICGRSFVTVYSLLTHIKAHSTSDVKRYKRVISLALSEIVGYHYKCRMCREKCTSIKDMREHVATHKGTESFKCEIGNHVVNKYLPN